MRAAWVLIMLMFSLASSGQQKQVCFTLDDLPVVSYGKTDSTLQKELFTRIVRSLKTNQVPAIGFVNGRKLYKDGKLIQYQAVLLQEWIAGGLELGNHTYAHTDYNSVSFREYASDIIKGESVFKLLPGERGKPTNYFRHTYLHVGNTKAKADSLHNFLVSRNYTEAPVTIDNEDYLFALAYARAAEKMDTLLQNRIGCDYIAYMDKKRSYYEMQSAALFGRAISQILLLHASKLNSDYLDALIAMYKANKYAFVSLDNALKDPAYQTEITVFGNWGISWIDRWALSKGKKGEFFKDDPATPEYIGKLAE